MNYYRPVRLVRPGSEEPTHGLCIFAAPTFGGEHWVTPHITLGQLRASRVNRGECRRRGKSFYHAYVAPLMKLCDTFPSAVAVSENLLSTLLPTFPGTTTIYVFDNPSDVGEGAVMRFLMAEWHSLIYLDIDNTYESNIEITNRINRVLEQYPYADMVRTITGHSPDGIYRAVIANQVFLRHEPKIREWFKWHVQTSRAPRKFPEYCYDEAFLEQAVLPVMLGRQTLVSFRKKKTKGGPGLDADLATLSQLPRCPVIQL